MVNKSTLVTSIKRRLGMHGLDIPGMDINEIINEVIDEETLPVFNELQPHVLKVKFDTNTMTRLQSSYAESVFIIPSVFGDREIMGIDNITPYDKYRMTSSPTFDDDLYGNMGALMLGQLNADMASLLEPTFSFDFESPNKLHLFNFDTVYSEIEVFLRLEHAKNLSTIPKTSLSSFKELAMLDCKIILYEMLKHYDEIESAHGRISLKISDWSNAESDRRDLISRWEDTYHLGNTQVFYM